MYWRSNWGVSTASGANGTKDEEASQTQSLQKKKK